jgi:hypothetical protein
MDEFFDNVSWKEIEEEYEFVLSGGRILTYDQGTLYIKDLEHNVLESYRTEWDSSNIFFELSSTRAILINADSREVRILEDSSIQIMDIEFDIRSICRVSNDEFILSNANGANSEHFLYHVDSSIPVKTFVSRYYDDLDTEVVGPYFIAYSREGITVFNLENETSEEYTIETGPNPCFFLKNDRLYVYIVDPKLVMLLDFESKEGVWIKRLPKQSDGSKRPHFEHNGELYIFCTKSLNTTIKSMHIINEKIDYVSKGPNGTVILRRGSWLCEL